MHQFVLSWEMAVMDDAVSGYRSGRHKSTVENYRADHTSRRKKTYVNDKKYEVSAGARFTRHLLIAVLLFAGLWAINTMKAPYAEFVKAYIKEAFYVDFEVNSIYNEIDNFLIKIGVKERSLQEEKNKSDGKDTETTAGTTEETTSRDEITDYRNDVTIMLMKSMKKEGQASAFIAEDLSDRTPGLGGLAEEMGVISDAMIWNEEEQADLKLLSPIAEGVVVSGYGKRLHPIKNVYEIHRGIDIDAPAGAKIRAADDGTVIKAEWSDTYGKYLIIRHNEKIATLYAHCSSLSVKKGDVVSRGKVIAKVGSTGFSTGTHLHFELRIDDVSVDPFKYALLFDE